MHGKQVVVLPPPPTLENNNLHVENNFQQTLGKYVLICQRRCTYISHLSHPHASRHRAFCFCFSKCCGVLWDTIMLTFQRPLVNKQWCFNQQLLEVFILGFAPISCALYHAALELQERECFDMHTSQVHKGYPCTFCEEVFESPAERKSHVKVCGS